MQVLYKAIATSTGGRDGRSKSSDGVLEVKLSTPKSLGGAGGDGTNPEQLFAAGYSACFIGAINKDKLRHELNIAPELTIMLIIALGEPAEEIVIESTADTNGNIRYWRDENQVHHVPKRSLEEVLVAAH